MFFLILAIVSAELVRSSCSERFLFCAVIQLSICILLPWSSVCSLLFLQFGLEFLVGVISMSIGTGLLYCCWFVLCSNLFCFLLGLFLPQIYLAVLFFYVGPIHISDLLPELWL